MDRSTFDDLTRKEERMRCGRHGSTQVGCHVSENTIDHWVSSRSSCQAQAAGKHHAPSGACGRRSKESLGQNEASRTHGVRQ